MPTSTKILVVDDDPRICRFLVKYLGNEGYRVTSAGSGTEMRELTASEMPDLIILDVVLPDENGFDLAREIRKTSNVGIIMLTGKTETIDKVVGLEIGADDYLSKPFNERELLARIHSVLRRVQESFSPDQASTRKIGKFKSWILNFEENELLSPDGTAVSLTSYEYQLLAVFVKNPNHVFSRDDILKIISGREWSGSDRSVDVLIGKLRKKLADDDGKADYIKTIRGQGYKFTATVNFE